MDTRRAAQVAKAQAKAFEQDVTRVVNALGTSKQVEILLPSTKRRPYPRIGARGKVVSDRRRGVAGRQPSNADVFAWFTHGTETMPARNFGKVTKYATDTITAAVVAKFQPQILAGKLATLNVGAIGAVVGAEWKKLLILRFEQSGYDLNPRGLSASWQRRKSILHLAPNIGKASGQLLDALRRAQVVVRNT